MSAKKTKGKKKKKGGKRGKASRRDVWAGAVVPSGPGHPATALWVDVRRLQPVYTHVYEANEIPNVAASFRAACANPHFGEPRVPRSVRVPTDDHATALLRAFPDLTVFVGPIPEVAEALERAETHSEARRRSTYDADGEVAEEDVDALFDAGDALWDAAPWRLLHDGYIFRVDAPALGVRGGALNVLGNLGQVFGVSFFDSYDDHLRFDAATRAWEGGPDMPIDMGCEALALHLDPVHELPDPMRQVVRARGRRQARHPHPLRIDRTRSLAPLRPEDVPLLAGIAAALAEIDPRAVVAQREVRAEARGVSLSFPYAGEVVPLRPGTPISPPEAFPAQELKERIVAASQVIGIFARTETEWDPFVEAGGLDEEEGIDRISLDLALYAEPRGGRRGKTLAQRLIDAVPLPPEMREVIEAQMNAWIGLWEVVDIGRDEIFVQDQLSGAIRCIIDRNMSRSASVGAILCGRVVDVPGSRTEPVEAVVSSFMPAVLPNSWVPTIRAYLADDLRWPKFKEIDPARLRKFMGQCAVAEIVEEMVELSGGPTGLGPHLSVVPDGDGADAS